MLLTNRQNDSFSLGEEMSADTSFDKMQRRTWLKADCSSVGEARFSFVPTILLL